MKKKENGMGLVFASAVTALILVLTVSFVLASVNRKMSRYCFDELKSTSRELGQDLYDTMQTDRTMLTAMAVLIASQDNPEDPDILAILNSFNLHDSYMSYLALLRPDNSYLKQDGALVDASGLLDFKEEAGKGAYISEKSISVFDSQVQVIRNSVPVVKNGEVLAVLYGVVSLPELAEIYTTDIYQNQAYVYLMDGTSGDFMLDTWHKTLGNIEDFRNRKTARGYDFETAIREMKNGLGGDLCFTSTTTGYLLYLHYEPTGINNWNVMVSVDRRAAFEKLSAINRDLYGLAAVIGVVLLVYMGFVTWRLRKVYEAMHRLDTEDRTTGLQNRNAYDACVAENRTKEFERITCIYIDANGLHEINNLYGHSVGDQMLRIVADALKQEFPFRSLFRIGGDEYVVLCETLSMEECEKKAANVTASVEKHDYTISVGIASRLGEPGFDRVIREADERMLANKRAYYASHDRRGNGARE